MLIAITDIKIIKIKDLTGILILLIPAVLAVCQLGDGFSIIPIFTNFKIYN